MNGRSISGCLLSIFFWIWMIVSAVSLLTAIAGMLRLPLYDQLKQDVPIPYEMLPAYAVTFMAYLISLLGILRDKSWGLFGFVGATLAIVAIQVASGIPLDKSVWILTNVTFLVVLLAFNERHTTCESDLIKMCRAGLASEEHDPREALKIYQLLDRINVTYHLNLLLTSLLSLPLAYIIAYYVTLRIGRYQDVIAVTLMCLLGIGPIVFLSVRRRRAEQRQAREADIWRQQTPKWLSRLGNVLGGIWKWGMLLVVFLFADVLQFTIILLIAAVALIALMLPIYLWQYLQTGPPLMPHPLTNFLSGITLLITFVVIASDVRLKPFSLSRILQEIPIALKENSDKIFSFLTNITLWFILLGTAVQHEVMYENLELGIIVYAFLGALIGWEHYREEKNQPLSTLSVIGQSRCLIELGKTAGARVKLERRLSDVGSDPRKHPEAFKQLAEALYMHLTGRLPPHLVRQRLLQAADGLDATPLYHDLCQSNIQRVQQVMNIPRLTRTAHRMG